MMRRIVFLLLLAAGTAQVQAQQARDGSLYSRLGVGELQSWYASKSHALGGGGLAYSSTSFVNMANPASLADQLFTRLSGGLRFEGIQTRDALDVESKLSASDFDGLAVGVPLIPSKVGIGLTFSKFSRVAYAMDITKPLDLGGAFDEGDDYAARFEGTGGLNRVGLGVGYRHNRMITVGIRFDVTFGIIDDIQQTVFSDLRFSDTRVVRSTRMHGLSAGLGARFSFPSILTEGDFLNLAVAVDLPTELTARRIRTEGEPGLADTLGTELRGTVDLPVSLSAGVLYQPSAKLSWNADVRYEPWSDFSSTLAFPGYDPAGTSNMRNRLRLSTGIEYFPAGRDLLSSYLRRTAYRLGVFRESGYASPSGEQEVNSFGATGGLSLPTLGAGTRIDINLDVGARGSATGSLVRDRFIRIGLHLNFAERWFARRQLG